MQREPDLVTGLVVFAGTLMVVVGVFHALVGIAALVVPPLAHPAPPSGPLRRCRTPTVRGIGVKHVTREG
jgi:hypothetical protein